MLLTKTKTICLSILLLLGCGWAQSDGCRFRSFKVQHHLTFAYGINNHGAIAGTYSTSNSNVAFIVSAGRLTTIVYPGATYTNGNAVNDLGQLVGTQAPNLFAANQSFLWINGVFTDIVYPGSLASYATGINVHGKIVGSYQDSQGNFHGFVYSGGTYTNFDYPNATSTNLVQLNNNGVMVGAFVDSANVSHGFIDNNGALTQVDYPGGTNTSLSGINDNNVVVGTFYDSTYSQYDGFVWSNGTFEEIANSADSTQTAVTGVNDSGVIIGNLDDTGTAFAAFGCTL